MRNILNGRLFALICLGLFCFIAYYAPPIAIGILVVMLVAWELWFSTR